MPATFTASPRRLLRAAAAQARSGDARQSFPVTYARLEAGRDARARDRARCARSASRSRASSATTTASTSARTAKRRRRRPRAAPGAARRRVLRAADRLRQRRQPAARVRPGAAARNRRSASRSAPASGDIARQLTASRCCSRLPAARSASCSRSGSFASSSCSPATTCRAPPTIRDRRPRARLHRRRLGRGRRLLRPVAAPPPPAEDADAGAARRRHADRQRRRRRRSATASSSPRSPLRSRCSSAPA